MPATHTSPKIGRLKRRANALGCPELILLDSEVNASQLEYLDLLPAKTGALLLPDAVAEFQGRPLLYLVDDTGEEGKPPLQVAQVQKLQTLLANRSEHACLGVVRPGSLDVYPINLDRKVLAEANFKTIQISDPDAPAFFQSLATGTFDLPGRPEQADYVYESIYGLLTAASKELAGGKDKAGPMRGLAVLSTTGRALFFRFLIDRRIVLPSELAEISPGADALKDAFSNAEKAAATSCWLDETFNGDLLPLVQGLTPETNAEERLRAYRRFYRDAGVATGQQLFSHLEAILRGWKYVGNTHFQTTLDWDDFNFAHIPIGVLSQVYETFSHQWDEEHAEQTSVYYTPRHLARLLVDEAFAGLRESADAVVLDPACGAGVFLVLAFRQLVRRSWEKLGTRPDTRTIQKILYKQLRGFEVSESALRLSALALYISAIEVNPTQRPPRSLKFPRPLRDEVLFNFGRHELEQPRGFTMGSLGSEVPATFDNSFDIVVTNPPWTSLRGASSNAKGSAEEKQDLAETNAALTALTRRALTARGLETIANGYTNPDNNPDLPFLWRATEWSKPGGIIAMALPGRIILKQSATGKAARDAIMRGLSVTGILNGSDLEKTPVWPKMDLPFILLFARNSLPRPDHHFHFATPIRENRLSSRGQFRLDYQAAESIASKSVIEKPWMLKALAVGTVLDVGVVDRLPHVSLSDYWKATDLYSGVGYILAPELKQQPADHLFNLSDFKAPDSGFCIQFDVLPTWRERYLRRTAHFPRSERLYQPPVVIVPKAPQMSREQPKAFLSRREAIAFSQSNYGFSAAGCVDGELLAASLYLAVHSILYQHFCLMRSSSQGAGFRIFLKEDLEAFPFPDPSRMSAERKRRTMELAEALETQVVKPWDEIDDFIFGLYGLDEHDATVVRDTVTFCGPYRSVREPSELPAGTEDLEVFRGYLEDMLQPLFQVADQKCAVRVLDAGEWYPPWRFVSVTLAGDQLGDTKKLLKRLMVEASKTGASRIVLRVPNGGLLAGILNQRRFWTRSRARLCSLHIERHHLDAFPLPAP
jgi:hypothetical protein